MPSREIPLGNGGVAIVDEVDFVRLGGFKWSADRVGRCTYASRFVGTPPNRRKIYLHREILKPKTGKLVDHINGDGLDNRRENLRICTKGQNQRNQRKQIGTSSRFKGVSFDKSRGSWTAYISINGKRKVLGRFGQEEVAAREYDAAAKKHYGDFAKLNFPQ